MTTAPSELSSRFHEPAGFRWGIFETADGAHLRWGHLAADNPRAACVLVGGFGEFAEKYFETVTDLTKMGLSVWFLDWRGQGGSTRPRTWPNRPRRRDFDRDANDLVAFTQHLLPRNLPRILMAHSMGGAIGILALAKMPDLFRSAVLCAPMFGVHTAPFPGVLAHVLAAFGVAWGLARAYAPGRGPWQRDPQLSAETSVTSHDPVRCGILQAWFAERPDLRVDGPTYGWVKSALDVAKRISDPALLTRIAAPMLIGSPREESFVDSAATERAAALLPRAKLVSFLGARHELFFELDDVREAWLAEIDGFVKRTVASAP